MATAADRAATDRPAADRAVTYLTAGRAGRRAAVRRVTALPVAPGAVRLRARVRV